jgi:hypothetical protein
MLTRAHRQEALCRAYVQAVAARAGLLCSKPEPDYGIDLALRTVEPAGEARKEAGVQLDLQLWATTRAVAFDSEVRYDLDVRTYEDLCRTPPIPRILIPLVQPADEEAWLSQSLEALLLRRCAYWLLLRGEAGTTASSSVRVAIPRSQVFSVEAAQTLLSRLAGGELP